MPDRLDETAISSRLHEVPAWNRRGDEITRTFKAPTFLGGISIVSEVAQAAEAANHHPDIDIRWANLTFVLTTHDVGGLSALDFDLATKIDVIAADHGVA